MRHFFSFAIMGLMVCVTEASAVNKIIYGDDNRTDVIYVNKVQKISKAVAGRISNSSFVVQSDNKVTFKNLYPMTSMFSARLCPDEKFSHQVGLTDCTGFLVDDDILVTAGHCLVNPGTSVTNSVNHSCARFSWMFDYKADGSGSFDADNYYADNIYGCKKIIHARVSLTEDFGIIQLDRKVKDRTPLNIRRSGKLSMGDEIFVVGHPTGLPMKHAGDAQVVGNEVPTYFSTNLDTFGGNSGSPVFNEVSHLVEGILVRGRTDFYPSTFQGMQCLRANVCKQDGTNCNANFSRLNAEHVTRISEILKYLK